MPKLPANAEDYVADTEYNVDDRPTGSPKVVKSGWDDPTEKKKSGFITDFKVDYETQVIRFIDQGGPVARYQSHFLTNKPSGRKSYVCLETPNCPLCNLDKNVKGRIPERKRAFSVINFSVDPFEVQLLTGGPRLYDMLHTMNHGASGPLNSKFWGISKTGERQTTAYHMLPIKARDLEEDWGINPETAEAMIASSVPFDTSIIRESSYEELAQIAADLS